MPRLQPETKIRTCLACGTQYEYPIKGRRASRHHCEICIDLPPNIRKAMERLFSRILKLEQTIVKLDKSGD